MFKATEDGRILSIHYEVTGVGNILNKQYDDLDECKSDVLDLIEAHIKFPVTREKFDPKIHCITKEVLFVYDPDNRTMKSI